MKQNILLLILLPLTAWCVDTTQQQPDPMLPKHITLPIKIESAKSSRYAPQQKTFFTKIGENKGRTAASATLAGLTFITLAAAKVDNPGLTKKRNEQMKWQCVATSIFFAIVTYIVSQPLFTDEPSEKVTIV